ncbi:zinc finger CCCH domain-containing protein 32-like isoform X1 [Hibiscus syriacus]|uniref:Zinc finger CCCH domain-containing protein 32-like isoform X1 n=1 Tax=Hibiscus syriacus TaxID=106335 RepID=A0A6A2XMC0_HIBSY|nr:zinc finger CCCH domain-containing protein 32-like isoform X1 [Hibiscus syriacus]
MFLMMKRKANLLFAHKSKLGLPTGSSNRFSSTAEPSNKLDRKAPFVSMAEMMREFQSSTRDLSLPHSSLSNEFHLETMARAIKNAETSLVASTEVSHQNQWKPHLTEPKTPVLQTYLRARLTKGEKECSYSLKMGQYKFGITCKFNHPQPAGTSISSFAPQFYQPVRSPSVRIPEQYGGASTNVKVARSPHLPGSFVQGTYGPVLFSLGMVPVQGWNHYSEG